MEYELASGGTVEVTNRNTGTPGLVQFTGAVTSTGGTGVNLDNNDNGTVTFSGGLVLSTGANAAYTATNGGTVSVTGATNTLTTTTGTALNLANTAIGASGLTFRSISTNGAARGIVLNNTGTSGSLTVTGNGGTCTAADTSGCSGGTIANATGADDSSTTPAGSGIVLNNTINAMRSAAPRRLHARCSRSAGRVRSGIASFRIAPHPAPDERRRQ